MSDCFPLLDPQVVCSRRHKIRDIALVPTEYPYHWRVAIDAIPHLNEIICGANFLAIYIHGEEGDVDICPIWLRDEIDTVSHSWILIWVGW